LIRSILKTIVESCLVGAGFSRRKRRKPGRRLAILAYHNVIPEAEDPSGDRSLHLPLDHFRSQLEFLRTHFDVLPLNELSANRHGRRPKVAITFDDAYQGALEYGIPAVRDYGLPATIFVCPGLLGAPGFWWDQLSDARRGLDPQVRDTALNGLKGRQVEVMKKYPSRGVIRDWMRPGDPDSVLRAGGEPGITLASHTWTHPNLSAIEPEEIEDELRRPLEWLRANAKSQGLQDHLSFPYGLFSDVVVRIAGEIGYRYFYRVDGGVAFRPISLPSVLPRLNIPAGLSLRGFDLRTSGVFS